MRQEFPGLARTRGYPGYRAEMKPNPEEETQFLAALQSIPSTNSGYAHVFTIRLTLFYPFGIDGIIRIVAAHWQSFRHPIKWHSVREHYSDQTGVPN
jgi:hypothetical protein